MGDITVVPEKVTRTGINLTDLGSLSTGNVYVIKNTGKVILHLKKTAAVIATATVVVTKVVAGLDLPDLTFAIPASTGDIMVGPFPPGIFNDGSKDMRISFSDVDGLTIAAFEIAGG